MDNISHQSQKMKLLRAVILVLWMITIITTTTSAAIEPCKTKPELKSSVALFNMNGVPMKTYRYLTYIQGTEDSKCEVNTTSVVEDLKVTGSAYYVIGFQCNPHQTVYFSEYNESRLEDVIFHVELSNCTFDTDGLNTLTNIADTRVFLGRYDTETTEDVPRGLDVLKNMVSYMFENLKVRQNFSRIFNESLTYPELAEVHLLNFTFDIDWNNIKDMLPNLQSLEVGKSNLQTPPPLFPWIDTFVALPRNLSRSQIMQSHYNRAEYVDVPAHLFRRYFNLAQNNITDLRNYSFHGSLHKITLTNNGLEFISNETFVHVQGLQNIDLSGNKLTSLPPGAFNNLNKLRKLDLSGNKLTELPPNLFDDLTSLQFLDLSNNSLESLPDFIFVRLINLQQIRLEHNRLLSLNPIAMPLQSVNLREIHLQFNPLTELPYVPFEIRGLQVANFQGTKITISNLTHFLENADYITIAGTVVDTASDTDTTDLLQRPDTLCKIDLRGCQISTLDLVNLKKLPKHLHKLLLILLLHFEFVLTDNPINCDCRNNKFAEFINKATKNGTLSSNEYFYKDWICTEPMELKDRTLLSVKPAETYCEVNVSNCPSECECYERAEISNIIVDCRGRYLTEIHSNLPDAMLELWYSNNNITTLPNFNKPENIISMDLSSNKMERIDANLIKRMINLKTLKLQNNILAYLPKTFEKLPLMSAEIWPNPFTCDCNSLWMKRWLLSHKTIVREWEKISCKVETEDGMTFTLTPDDKFTCNTQTPFDELRYVVLPSVLCSFVVVVIAICAVLVYTYRLECKVLMFVYFGFHPFDKDSDDLDEKIDCVIVHSGKQTGWVMERIVALLESESYAFVVCDMARDFVVGYSFQENLTRTVRHSKRMIFCVSPDWNRTADSFKIAWRIAQEKIKDSKSHYAIVVAHEINASEVGDKDMERLIKQGRYVNSSEKLFGDKIVYYMPQSPKPANNTDIVRYKPQRQNSEYISKCFKGSLYLSGGLPECVEQKANVPDPFAPVKGSHVHISYHIDDLEYVMSDIIPLLETKGYTYCIADRDFVPGASKEENILNAINGSDRTMYVMSKAHIADEWSLFTFRTAYEKSLREKYNHLIVVIKENVDTAIEDEEMKYYLKNYICLHTTDRWFVKKLINGLPRLKPILESRVSILQADEVVGVENVVMEIEQDEQSVHDVD